MRLKSMRTLRYMASGLAAAVAAGLFAVAPAAASATPGAGAGCCMGGAYLQTGLRGGHSYPHAGGHAGYQSWYGHRELHVRMWNLRRLRGQILVVYVHGTRAGIMRVTRYGDAWLNQRHGMPMCRAGQRIQVETGHGILVAAGTWRARR